LPQSSGPVVTAARRGKRWVLVPEGALAAGPVAQASEQVAAAIVFDRAGRALARAQRELTQHYPASGWVEHDPEEIWEATLAVCREAIAASGRSPAEVAGIGITNQRETTLVWERESGRPIHRAIVWQDRRTAPACDALRAAGHEETFARRTGLLLDP
jgi:glycerol kinase